MSAVEIRLHPGLLSREMGAMRVWLDQHRFEPSSFSCRDYDDAVLVSLEFKLAHQAHAFAVRFGGHVNGSSITQPTEDIESPVRTGLSPTWVIG